MEAARRYFTKLQRQILSNAKCSLERVETGGAAEDEIVVIAAVAVMSLPFDAKGVRDYPMEFGCGGHRLCCEFRLQDGSVLFLNDSQIMSTQTRAFGDAALHEDRSARRMRTNCVH